MAFLLEAHYKCPIQYNKINLQGKHTFKSNKSTHLNKMFRQRDNTEIPAICIVQLV